MKKLNSKKAVLYFYLFDLILLSIVIIALFFIPKKNSVKTKKAVILNTKYLSQIDSIQISDLQTEDSLFIKKSDFLWYGFSKEKEKFIFPCNTENLNLLLSLLTQVKELTLLTESETFHEYYNIGKRQGKKLSFFQKDRLLTSITFGKEDSLKETIAFKMDEQKNIYETSFQESLLTTDRSFWCDPYICPLIVSKNQEESERSLRRGRLEDVNFIQDFSNENDKNNFSTISVNLTNGSKVLLKIKKEEDSYLVKPEFLAYQNKEKEAFSIFNYSYRISESTYMGLQK